MKKFYVLLTAACLFFIFLAGCVSQKQDLTSALESIKAEELSQNVAVLSSDEFEGRGPSSPGETKTVNFLRDKFKKLGLKPGNGQSYFQEVPMVAITTHPSAELEVKSNNKSTTFSYGPEFMAWTLRVKEKVSVADSDMVFVGYGIVAPEYDWNDYQGLDVKGKTVVMLVNDPGFTTKNPQLFKGRAMTYYGRWTYKFEEAARQGAAAAFIIHETEPAAYPWEVVKNSWSGENFHLIAKDNNTSRCAVEGWFYLEATRQIFGMAGLDYEQLKSSAASRGFKAVPLRLKSSIELTNRIRKVTSRNVIALWPGSKRADEYIFYMAHWDHFGRNPSLEGDQIFNGAVDNATGTAGLIELAEAFTKLKKRPLRSIVFLAVTGEEQGLLGSAYYATHPIYPLTKTAAAINMDALNVYGQMKDITVIGYGNSELDDYVEQVAAEQRRRVRPDPTPEKGSFFRSDHFSFAKQGVPALFTSGGLDHVKYGEEWTRAKNEEYLKEKYHKPTDEFDPNWDLSGAIDDLRLLFKVGYRLSMESTFPNWKEGSEFKTKREAEMAEAQVANNK